MKHILTLAALVFATSCFGQESCANDIDINGNGTVDITDFLNVLGLFGDVDSDGDGVWDSQDLCSDLEACNYDQNPSEPCADVDVLGVCGGQCEADEDQDGVCDIHTCGQPLVYHGKHYQTVQIGEQCWFAENLATGTFAQGDSIPYVADGDDWTASNVYYDPAYCFFGNDSSSLSPSSMLYNWPAVIDDRGLCPFGWHVPTNSEWNVLRTYLGGDEVAGYPLKSSPEDDPSWNGSNETGFSALPGA